MPRTKKKSVCTRKPTPVVADNDDSDSDPVDDLQTAEKPEEVLSQEKESNEKKKRHAKNVMFAETEDALIEWIRETPCFTRRVLEITEILRRDIGLG